MKRMRRLPLLDRFLSLLCVAHPAGQPLKGDQEGNDPNGGLPNALGGATADGVGLPFPPCFGPLGPFLPLPPLGFGWGDGFA
jgi:hypothetical protein